MWITAIQLQIYVRKLEKIPDIVSKYMRILDNKTEAIRQTAIFYQLFVAIVFSKRNGSRPLFKLRFEVVCLTLSDEPRCDRLIVLAFLCRNEVRHVVVSGSHAFELGSKVSERCI